MAKSEIMAVTRIEFDNWVKRGKKMGATHLISVVDTFDYDDYPVFVMPEDDLEEVKSKYDGVEMQRINEVIELSD
jgi:hypothetical protein